MAQLLILLFSISQLGLLLLMILIFPAAVGTLVEHVGNVVCIVMLLSALVLFIIGFFVVMVLADSAKIVEKCHKVQAKQGAIVCFVSCVYMVLFLYLRKLIYQT